MSEYTFQMEWEHEEDGSVYGSILNFDLVGNAPTVEELRQELARQLVEYAQDYMKDLDMYLKAPNRKDHYPFVVYVLTMADFNDVVGLIRT